MLQGSSPDWTESSTRGKPGTGLKITLICHDMPYPPNHGARVDMWRRIKAIHSCGTEIQLITWISALPTPHEILELERYVSKLHLIPFGKITPSSLMQRVNNLRSYPLEITSRIVRGKALEDLLAEVQGFEPSVILVDGLHGGELALRIHERLRTPIVTRSHNVEHLYYKRLLASASGIGKLRRLLSLSNLEKFERALLQKSSAFYDISIEDLNFWQKQGFTHGRYLPPFVEFSEASDIDSDLGSSDDQVNYDIVFLGNLCSDNNVSGVTWFIMEVLPLVRLKRPNVDVLIAGSNPVKKIEKLCAEQTGVKLRVNPPSAAGVYRSGHVLINPIRLGSGVSIKSLEMLAAGRSIVSIPQGIAGLPEQVKQHFRLAQDAPSFAEQVVEALSEPREVSVNHKLLESLFGYNAIEQFLAEVRAVT